MKTKSFAKSYEQCKMKDCKCINTEGGNFEKKKIKKTMK
jgi:hypothetical protein